jgi:hypothetical protein
VPWLAEALVLGHEVGARDLEKRGIPFVPPPTRCSGSVPPGRIQVASDRRAL